MYARVISACLSLKRTRIHLSSKNEGKIKSKTNVISASIMPTISGAVHGVVRAVTSTKFRGCDLPGPADTFIPPDPSAIAITRSAAASVERAGAQSSGRQRAAPRSPLARARARTHTSAAPLHLYTCTRGVVAVGQRLAERGLFAATVGRRCYRVGPD
jgi:hypothetical protein